MRFLCLLLGLVPVCLIAGNSDHRLPVVLSVSTVDQEDGEPLPREAGLLFLETLKYADFTGTAHAAYPIDFFTLSPEGDRNLYGQQILPQAKRMADGCKGGLDENATYVCNKFGDCDKKCLVKGTWPKTCECDATKRAFDEEDLLAMGFDLSVSARPDGAETAKLADIEMYLPRDLNRESRWGVAGYALDYLAAMADLNILGGRQSGWLFDYVRLSRDGLYLIAGVTKNTMPPVCFKTLDHGNFMCLNLDCFFCSAEPDKSGRLQCLCNGISKESEVD